MPPRWLGPGDREQLQEGVQAGRELCARGGATSSPWFARDSPGLCSGSPRGSGHSVSPAQSILVAGNSGQAELGRSQNSNTNNYHPRFNHYRPVLHLCVSFHPRSNAKQCCCCPPIGEESRGSESPGSHRDPRSPASRPVVPLMGTSLPGGLLKCTWLGPTPSF